MARPNSSQWREGRRDPLPSHEALPRLPASQMFANVILRENGWNQRCLLQKIVLPTMAFFPFSARSTSAFKAVGSGSVSGLSIHTPFQPSMFSNL